MHSTLRILRHLPHTYGALPCTSYWRLSVTFENGRAFICGLASAAAGGSCTAVDHTGRSQRRTKQLRAQLSIYQTKL
jgi:hypothetical protein